MKAVLTSLTGHFCRYLSRSRFKQRQIRLLISLTKVLRFSVTFWVIFGHFWETRNVCLKNRWNWECWRSRERSLLCEDSMDLENWNLKRRISRWTPNSPLPNWGSLLWVNCLVVFPTHFNPDNSLLKLLSNFFLHRKCSRVWGPLHTEPGQLDWLGFRDLVSPLLTTFTFVNISMCSYEKPGWPGYRDLGFWDRELGTSPVDRDKAFLTK